MVVVMKKKYKKRVSQGREKGTYGHGGGSAVRVLWPTVERAYGTRLKRPKIVRLGALPVVPDLVNHLRGIIRE